MLGVEWLFGWVNVKMVWQKFVNKKIEIHKRVLMLKLQYSEFSVVDQVAHCNQYLNTPVRSHLLQNRSLLPQVTNYQCYYYCCCSCNSINFCKTSLGCLGIRLSTSTNTQRTIFWGSIIYVRRLENVPNPGMDSEVPYAFETVPPFWEFWRGAKSV